jgi:hypothetical protein
MSKFVSVPLAVARKSNEDRTMFQFALLWMIGGLLFLLSSRWTLYADRIPGLNL